LREEIDPLTEMLGRLVVVLKSIGQVKKEAEMGGTFSGIPSFLNGQDFGVFPRFGPTRSAQIG
jgi:hypothetical protein